MVVDTEDVDVEEVELEVDDAGPEVVDVSSCCVVVVSAALGIVVTGAGSSVTRTTTTMIAATARSEIPNETRALVEMFSIDRPSLGYARFEGIRPQARPIGVDDAPGADRYLLALYSAFAASLADLASFTELLYSWLAADFAAL